MRIVVLDGYTLNPGDLSWSGLQSLGEATIYERTPADRHAILERVDGAEIVLTNKTPLNGTAIRALRGLRYIGLLASGYDVVDVAAARDAGVVVTNIPSYGTDSVAQMAFAHILHFCHHLKEHSDSVKAGEWASREDFCYSLFPLMELAGKTMGVVGFGRIGRRLGELAHAFHMRVVAQDVQQSSTPAWPGFAWLGLEELFSVSDFVSLHCPLTQDNVGMIDARALRAMKPTAFLVNMSRGPLVVDRDLAAALHDGVIAGAGIDVLEQEPPAPDNPLYRAPNLTITPHIAWATREARTRLLGIAVDNVQAFLAGAPVNAVR